MPSVPTTITDELGIALGNLADTATGTITPTLRLGVTGLSRAGKTIFITALIHNLLTGARLPGFAPMAEGRLIGVRLAEHPDNATPRFAYENHLAALLGTPPVWPESTRRISQLRLTLRYQSNSWLKSQFGVSTLNLDIVDYPGEWLLDLPLLTKSFAEWSAEALALAHRPARADEAKPFLDALSSIDPLREADDVTAETLAAAFTQYLRASKGDARALSTLPPGRFLMPGDLEGSPALTFAPLPEPASTPRHQSLYAMLERRYEAYKSVVVRPFFRDHFARLDRQIVLVDALRALNAGPEAVADLETALTSVLSCFRQGSSNPISRLFTRKIDRILFAATKADLLHHTSHPRLEAILNRLVANASRRAKFAGAETRSLAIAAIRATREGTVKDSGETLATIIGTPENGQRLGDTVYDGTTEIALFPGDLPENPESLFKSVESTPQLNFLRFLPPTDLPMGETGDPVFPHIRLDRALDFLIGDKMQ
ncbi:YcjX family protein [Pelagibacterium sp. H642]|uniref:YcjX family protein n=1 Tax=Pelagibacterium sp. H642 TaxID=1881069 RepID=UPI0028152762|nr:YcjX family protein [Pelagibacterium sp. H642]WMT89975.1 YcjX family protein [Pelagibacterium sp. H642]